MSTISPESIEISTIKLNLNGLVVELKVEEARKLWAQLDDLFGPKPAPYVYYPIITPVLPSTTDPVWVSEYDLRLARPDWSITCNAYTGNSLELR